MEILLENFSTIIISIAAVIAAFILLKNEMKRFIDQSKRDTLITISKSELQNLLNESFELTNKMSSLVTQKIGLEWEIKYIKDRLINAQKYRIRQEGLKLESVLKNMFNVKYCPHRINADTADELIKAINEAPNQELVLTSYEEVNTLQLSFANAISVIVLELKASIYDLCQENGFIHKSEREWETYVNNYKISYGYDSINKFKSLFPQHMKFSSFDIMITEIQESLENFVIDSLNTAKSESLKINNELLELSKQKNQKNDEIKKITEQKNNAIIERYISKSK